MLLTNGNPDLGLKVVRVGLGVVLPVLPAFFLSVISLFFTQNKGEEGPQAPGLDPPLLTWLALGDSSVLHFASPLRTVFALSTRANERVHVHKLRDFAQAKFDSEINGHFLLNKQRKVPFLFH